MFVATAAMAFFTWRLARETRRLEESWRETTSKQVEAWFKTSSEEIGVRTWMAFAQRFDSAGMVQARRRLAQQLKDYSLSKHGKVSETVLNFFEDLGSVYRRGHLDKELAVSTFSFHACRWWEAAKAYVDQERKRHKADTTVFQDFEHVAKELRLPVDVLDDAEIECFLDDEMKSD